MAVADKIRQMSSAKDLEKIGEDVLPHFEKFLESPEERRLRRIRAGIITAAIGLGATIVTLLMAFDEMGVFPFVTPSLVTFLVGLGLVINGLLFTVPRKQLPGDAYDALSQKVLDAGVNRVPYEAPALTPPTSLTNELTNAPSSVTEHTTHHLTTRKS